MISVMEFVLPEFIMPYLINGDRSGLDEDAIYIIDHWYDRQLGEYIGHWGDCPDHGDDFRKYHDLTSYGIKACNCIVIDFVITGRVQNE